MCGHCYETKDLFFSFKLSRDMTDNMQKKTMYENNNQEAQWFGQHAVTPNQKTQLVRGVFDSVADKYDIMNDLMSGGIHRLWKDRFVRLIRPRSSQSYIDVAGGTGDIAFRIYQYLKVKTDIAVIDLNENMLRAGRDRAINKGWLNEFQWCTGNAESLPVADESYDVYSIAFGLRNVTHIDTALHEAFRVLKHGGRFYCLEFSHVNNNFLSRAYKLYSQTVIPNLGRVITQDKDSYQYLIESIERFPDQNALSHRISKAGFDNVRHINLSGGIAAIHMGWKI